MTIAESERELSYAQRQYNLCKAKVAGERTKANLARLRDARVVLEYHTQRHGSLVRGNA